jgi:hypothetical protein
VKGVEHHCRCRVGVITDPMNMGIIPNLKKDGQLAAMLAAYRKRKDGIAKA